LLASNPFSNIGHALRRRGGESHCSPALNPA
jgi:hypothetical protein